MSTELQTPERPPESTPVAYADPFTPRPASRAGRWVATVVLAVAAFAAGLLLRDAVRGWFAGGGAGGSAPATATQPAAAKQLWTCGMHPQVIQDHPGDCPICHMELTPLKTEMATAAAGGERVVKYWWDPMMNPPYISDQPGKSPMGMDLVPVYADEVAAGVGVMIDPVIVQNMGVRVATVERASVQQDVRAVGYLQEPEPLRRDVNLRVNGWIEKLHADVEGMAVEKGQPLFDLYSPEMQVAVEELIAARKSRDAATDEQSRRMAATLYDSAARKLELWGLERKQVEELAVGDRAPETVTFLSPIGGHVVEKQVYAGAGVTAGTQVMRLADRSRMWLDAQVHEQQLPLVNVGSRARATVVATPGKVHAGEVVFIHPHLDPATRTATVRIELPNDEHALKQGMYATVEILADPEPPATVVPREAILDTGTRQVAFVALGNGHFEPRQLELGLSGQGGLVQVLSGVAPGEQVVTSGQFLLDSESRLKEAIQKHLSGQLASRTPPPGHDDHGVTSVGAPAPAPAVTPAAPLDVPHVDEIAVAYLEVSQALGARQQSDDPVGLDRVLAAARTSAEHAPAGEAKDLVAAVVAAAEGMAGKPLPEQREAFIALSDAVVKLLDRSPPSAGVAPELYVVHCPMAFHDEGASWLQTTKSVANPYYATQMKTCGEVKRAIAARK